MRATATRFVLASILLLIAAPLASAQKAIDITPSSIAGAKLGWSQARYRQLLGPARVDRLEGGFTRLVFGKRKVAAYLRGGKGVALTTWSRRLVDENGVTPCSTVALLKGAWPSGLAAVEIAGAIAGYRRGALLYAVGGKRVEAVMLGPRALNFIGLNETACR